MQGRNSARIPRAPRTMSLVIRQNIRLQTANWTGSNIFAALAFQLSDVPSYTSLTAVWDEYKLSHVKLHFSVISLNTISTSFNVATGVDTGNLTPPQLIVASDYTDANTPTLAQLLTHEDLSMKGYMNQVHTHDIKPVTQTALYQGGFTGYGRSDNQWIEINSAGVNHYGVKYGIIEGLNSSSNSLPFVLYATYTIQLRKVVG